MLVNFSFSGCRLLTFFKKFFLEHYQSVKRFPDQDQHSVGIDLGSNCCKGYQQTTKVAASKESVQMYLGP